MDEDLELTVDGKVYRSLEELPPELREKLAAHVEKARAAAAAAGAPGAKIRINLTHKAASFTLGGLKLGASVDASAASAPHGSMGPQPPQAQRSVDGPGAGPLLGASSGGAWRQWLFWLVLFLGLVLLFQRLKGR